MSNVRQAIMAKWIASLYFFIAIMGNVLAETPSWMVRIVKNNNGCPVTSTGYIVKIGEKFLIKSTAHGVLGNTEGVSVFDYQNRELNILKNDYISDSSSDDFLVSLAPGDYKALGTYNIDTDQFVIDEETFNEGSSHEKSVSLEAPELPFENRSTLASYIVPPWLDKSSLIKKFREISEECNCDNLYKNYSRLYQITPFSYNQLPFDESLIGLTSSKNLTRTLNPDVLKINGFQIVPGESGAPFIRWYRKPLEIDPEKVIRLTVENGRNYAVYKNPNGEEVRIEYGQKLYPIIGGHVLGYHRSFAESKFISLDNPKNSLAQAYLSNERKEISQTSWDLQGGEFHRVQKTEDYTVREALISFNRASNGTGGSGANGTGGSGANGTGGSGANGTGGSGGSCQQASQELKYQQGIEINGEQVLALRLNAQANVENLPNNVKNLFQSGVNIAADWDNFQYLTQLEQETGRKLFSLVNSDNSIQNLKDRLLNYNLNPNKNTAILDSRFLVPQSAHSCHINYEKLQQGTLEIKIYSRSVFSSNIQDEPFYISEWPLDQIPPLFEIPNTSEAFPGAVIDFTSLWGLNLSNTNNFIQESQRYLHPFISLKSETASLPTSFSCVIPKSK